MLPFRIRHAPVLAFALILGAWTGAAHGSDLPPLRSLQPPLFSADVSVAIDSAAHPSVHVVVSLPYSELSWNLIDQGYAAGAGFSIVLEPIGRGRLYGDSFEKRLRLDSYGATRSTRFHLVVERSFDVPPGRYRVRVGVRDVSSELESTAQDVLQLEDLARVPLGFSDLELGVLDSTASFRPVSTRRFGYDASGLAARVVTFDRRPGEWPRTARFRFRITEDTGDLVVQGDTTIALTQTAQSVTFRPPSTDLFIGSYVFGLERVEGKSRWQTSRSFEVEESGPPTGREYTDLLEALAYVADESEVDPMRNLKPEQQAEAWDRFWRRRDPTPETAVNEFQIEFFRRLHYAEHHFQGFGPGWRSDMGRIYVRYGPPDQIESQAASTAMPQLEIWYYHQPYHRFVFADREGFGRFTLLTPGME